ncbi:hypothetical protein Ocin01_00510 [Orchesella cincta]|uniref:Uncharacterized protein n=1 Tax=Orchesella cincta TaxID=48709 RepID=A0A1D2NLN9_ORCCI|nr:hypothetical protein Ocin01_00510 [Orchesella cincta]
MTMISPHLTRNLSIFLLAYLLLAVSCDALDTTTTMDPTNPPTAPWFSCYVCRSDRDINCIKHPDKVPTIQCTEETHAAFLDDLERFPPEKPVPKYTRSTGITKWGCHRMISSDKTFVLRSCAVIAENQEDGCNYCRFKDHWAWCCYCQDSDCNSEVNRGSRPVLGIEGNDSLIRAVTVGLFTVTFNLYIKTCLA